MSMKEIFESYRKGSLIKEQDWFKSSEEDSPGVDFQRAQLEPDGTELSKGAVKKGAKAFKEIHDGTCSSPKIVLLP